MNEKILFVDDDANILEAYQRKLQKVLTVETADGGEQALWTLRERGPFAVVIADMHMPSMNGSELLARVREEWPETVRMMLTGDGDIKTAVQAVNEGNIFRFLCKPCPSKTLVEALVAGLNQYRLMTAEKNLLEGTLSGAVELVTEVLSWADPDAFGRAIGLRAQARSICKELGLTDIWDIELGAMFLQIGSMAVPGDLLAKVRAGEELGDEETEMVRRIPEIGHELLARIPRLDTVARIVLYQNKRYDGTGFPPDDVAKGDIPLGARVLKVLNDFADLVGDGMTKDAALVKMQGRKDWYDPRVVAALRSQYPKMDDADLRKVSGVIEVYGTELQAGDVLVTSVQMKTGTTLLGAGQTISDAILVRIANYSRLGKIHEPIEVRRP